MNPKQFALIIANYERSRRKMKTMRARREQLELKARLEAVVAKFADHIKVCPKCRSMVQNFQAIGFDLDVQTASFDGDGHLTYTEGEVSGPRTVH